MKEKFRKREGSFTIELALLMPFILGVILFILFMAYYLHDCCIIEKACLSAALRGSQEFETGQIENAAYEALEEVLPDRLLGKFELTEQIQISEEQVTVSEEGSMEMREGLLRALLGERQFFFSTVCSAKRIEEPTFIRKQKRQGRGYCSGKAMKEK